VAPKNKPMPADLRDLAGNKKIENRDGVFLCTHTGTSMNPTLNASDLLEIRPYQDRLPRTGDVVLCLPDGYEGLVVHRVTKRNAGQIRTRGDNSKIDDSWVLRPEQILGRVLGAQRNRKRRRIAGGFAGVLCGRLAGWRRIASRAASRILHGAYYGLAGSGFIYRVTPAALRPQTVAFGNGEQRRVRLLIGHRFVVGQYDTNLRLWRIRRPFRLLLSPEQLKDEGWKVRGLEG